MPDGFNWNGGGSSDPIKDIHAHMLAHYEWPPPRLLPLVEAFVETLRGFGVPEASARSAYEPVRSAYAQPSRHYHSSAHIAYVLNQVAKRCARVEPAVRDEVNLALWFHDLIYVPGAPANELASAAEFATLADKLKLDPERSWRIRSAIVATSHKIVEQKLPLGRVAELTVDADLAILGASWAEVVEYDAQICREYAHVPPSAFRAGRRKVVAALLASPPLFRTPEFADLIEPARDNLAHLEAIYA